MSVRAKPLPVLLVAMAMGCAGGGEATDLGAFGEEGKADSVGLTVEFEVPPGEGGEPGEIQFTLRTIGLLALTTEQRGSWERLQIVARTEGYRRRSWRGRSPFLTVPATVTGGDFTEYRMSLLNWGDETATGRLHVTIEEPHRPGVEVIFNQPDCDGCEDPSGGMRGAVVDAIQRARSSIDMAVYGIDDPTVLEALCNAAEDGVRVRAIIDDVSMTPDVAESYYDAFFDPDLGLASCGVEIEPVRSSAIMHDKFLVIDAGTDDEVLLLGSANYTVSGFDVNHNSVAFVYGASELMEAFTVEFEQLFTHCVVDRLDGASRCRECTARCVEDRNDEGPWALGDATLSAYFAPSDDPLVAIRGEATRVRVSEPDPTCGGRDADCVCRESGAAWYCDYCALGADGFALLDEAERRLYLDIYSATDACFALGVARAAERGVEVFAIWDYVNGASPFERDDFLCAAGIEVLASDWSETSARARNHNKFIVVDDTVVLGSLNFSRSGSTRNNEATLVVESAPLAAAYAAYARSEAELLRERGVRVRHPDECRCTDLVDNDGDGAADGDDDDCDGVGRSR